MAGERPRAVVLREPGPGPGDHGWVVVRHGVVHAAAGFALVEDEHHRSFGADLIGQHWARERQGRPGGGRAA